MVVPDYMLDTSWLVQYIPSQSPIPSLYNLLRQTSSRSSIPEQLHNLSIECRDYVLSRAPTYKDELNDETEKTGVLRECVITHVKSFDTGEILGLSIETRYQKTTYKVVLVARSQLDSRACPVSTMMYKASQSHIKKIKDWLDEKYELSPAVSLWFSPGLVPRLCSGFLMGLDEAWGHDDDNDVLRQVTLKQVVGNLKITIAISQGTGAGIAPQLKSIDLDIPVETVGALLQKVKRKGTSDRSAFLDKLAGAIHERTGLRLPLNVVVPDTTQNTMDGRAVSENAQPGMEPPLKITRITCSAFALRADGAVKLNGKPIEDAEVYGYNESAIRREYMNLLHGILEEVERRQQEV